MTHKFVVRIDQDLKEYSNYEDIPNEFDNLISFEPVIPPEPHTEEQHDEIEKWGDRLKELMKREIR
tara:strand:+ start:939 stop:1136 length:198 start_codon:yes stop_codon:yes gene_type:complete